MGTMQFAMILLGILIAACVCGSVISQEKAFSWYSEAYGERMAAFITFMHLDDVFHSWWFVLITGFLCLNLLLCSILRLPVVLKQWGTRGSLENIRRKTSSVSATMSGGPEVLFDQMHFRGVRETTGTEGQRILYSIKGQAGLWGAWVCHLGVLVLILGFALGQMLKEEYTVYGIPGQTKQVADTDYLLTIDDFHMDLRDDGSVSQYTADLTVRNAHNGESASGSASVNEPASLLGMKYYQNSTGWAADVTVEKDGEELQKDVLCAGEFTAVSDKPDLVIYFNAFYPDYALVSGNPVTMSNELNNPAYLYSVYYQGNMIGMNALTGGDYVTIDEYKVSFTNPQTYTLIQVKRDRFMPLAFAGGMITLAGLFLALFVWPASMLAEQREDGTCLVSAECRKGGQIFIDEFTEAAKKNGGLLSEEESGGQQETDRGEKEL